MEMLSSIRFFLSSCHRQTYDFIEGSWFLKVRCCYDGSCNFIHHWDKWREQKPTYDLMLTADDIRSAALEKMNGRQVESGKDTMRDTDRERYLVKARDHQSFVKTYKNPTQMFAGMFASVFFHWLLFVHMSCQGCSQHFRNCRNLNHEC